MHTELELAVALRSAAEFCLDPNSPKAKGQLCVPSAVEPWHPDAHAWCAIGWVEHQLGGPIKLNRNLGHSWHSWTHRIEQSFDAGLYTIAAAECLLVAAAIEAQLPVTEKPAEVATCV